VTGVEMFKKLLDEGLAGDNVGLLLRGRKKKTWSAGKWFASRFDTPHTKFKRSIRLDEGRRRPSHAVFLRLRRSFISAPRT